MDKSLAFKIINLCANLEIRRCTLLGGEPTLHPNIIEILEKLRDKKITTGLVTNGAKFSDFHFTQRLKPLLGGVTVALKAGNEKDFTLVTRSSIFSQVVKGIKNLKKVCIPFNVSILINNILLDRVEGIIRLASDLGVGSVQLDICNPTISSSVIRGDLSPDPYVIAKKLSYIDKRVKEFECRVNYAARIPFCNLPKRLIKRAREEDRLVSGCQLNRHDGLIFDPLGKILPCNLLSECVLGEFGTDFNDPASFEKFWQGKEVTDFFNATKRVPSEECNRCDDYNECCGGCPVRWFYFEPSRYIKKGRR